MRHSRTVRPLDVIADRQDRLTLGVLALWAVLALAFAVRLGGTAQDDAFITYRYAWNLARGEGLVFNPGEKAFGLTEPGWALLLAGLHTATGVPVPWLGTALTGAALVALALLLQREAGARRARAAGLLGGTLIVSSTAIWSCRGAAAPAVLALLVAAAFWAPRRPTAAGLLAGAAVWLRPDAAVGAAIVVLLETGRRKRIPWGFALVAAAVALAGAGLAWLWFGSPLPTTLAAKRALARLDPATWPSGLAFWRPFGAMWGLHSGPLAPLLLGLGIAGQAPLLRRSGSGGRLLSLHAAALAVAYPLLGVPFYPWYAIPAVAALLYGIAYSLSVAGTLVLRIAARVAARRSAGLPRRAVGAALAVVLVALIGPLLARELRLLHGFREDSHLAAYRRAAAWVRAHGDAQDAVAYYEVGVLGYVSRRPVADLLGLVSPWAIPYAARGDLAGALAARPARFVLDHSARRVGDLPGDPWFRAAYEEAARFRDAGGGRVTVYRRRGVTMAP